ncbi:hypothetical protein D3C72_1302350 [compost metagenome]
MAGGVVLALHRPALVAQPLHLGLDLEQGPAHAALASRSGTIAQRLMFEPGNREDLPWKKNAAASIRP